MFRTRSLRIAVLAVVVVSGCSGEKDTRGERAPSVFVIVIDAASAAYFGCYGDPGKTSPNIDALAAESILFENAYSQTSTTVSSTASLMTGVRATTHRMTDRTVLPTEFETMPQALARQGMNCFGVIGNPFAGAPATGLDRGYKEAVQVYALEALQKSRRTEESSHFIVTLPDDINSEVAKLLPKFQPTGTFAYIHFLQPHKPYTPPESHLRLYEAQLTDWDKLHDQWNESHRTGRADESTIRGLEARYRANIHYVDAAVGELFGKLREAGLYDESMIVFLSDHGEAFFKHRRFGHNATVYDDMTRIPLIIKFPKSAGVKPGRISNLVETIDVLPTIFEFLKLSPPDKHEGDSLWGLATGDVRELSGSEVIVCTVQRSRHAMRIRDHKLVISSDGRQELFDLRKDPDEQDNLALKEPENARRMRELLESVVDIRGGTAAARSNKLRDDPKMKALIESLGYTGGSIDEEFEIESNGRSGASSTTRPVATTQPAASGPD
ncbi:MAG: sulfatase-like hydrolase/transferase [Phycisphaerae bacterium]|nr:sulfatase-like hydrolase/transferase [Phycisphaerae bacterium]